MAAETNVKSTSIGNLDATPFYLYPTAGAGARQQVFSIDDYAAVTAVGIASAGSYYRLLRIPTNSIIKTLAIFTSTALDTNASNTLTFDIGLAFSDSTIDGTNPSLQGLIPTTANDGATTTTFGSYSSPNKIFGGITTTQLGHTAALAPTQVEFNGLTSGYTMAKIMSQPLWQIFGFVDGRGMPCDPGGFFDVYAYATAGAATGAAGTLGARATYVTL
jgi:hypothetical protein